MTISLSLQYRTEFTISPERSQRIDDACLDKVNYSNQDEVQQARAAIVHMGIWDKFVDKVFHFGSKQRALDAIATIILGAKANERKVNNPVWEVGRLMVQSAKEELVTLLSRDGARDFAKKWLDTNKGIQFFPQTDDDEFDRLLAASVFPYDLAARLWEKADMHYLASVAWGKEASFWRGEGRSERAEEADARADAQLKLALTRAPHMF